ncbi:MAG: hypothetical protein ACRYFZ_17775 [Janthinobacterium lividum]
MTRAHEQLYLQTLHTLVAVNVSFCVLGTFGLRQQCPELPPCLVADCDLILPADPAALTTLVRHLQATGWVVSLWEQPVALPLTAELLAGKYYLRARQAGAVLDCAYENDYLNWPDFVARCRWHNGLPLLAAEHILTQKAQCNRPADQLVLRWYRAAVSDQGAAASGVSQSFGSSSLA